MSWLPLLLLWPQTNPEALSSLKACSESLQRSQAAARVGLYEGKTAYRDGSK